MERQLLMAEARSASLRLVDMIEPGQYEERVRERVRIDAAFLGETLIGDEERRATRTEAYADLRMRAIAEERRAVLRARMEGRYSEASVRAVLTVLDIEEAAVSATIPDRSS